MSEKVNQTREDFQPILLGTDFNCYGMARSFYQQYGIKSIAYGVMHMAPTRYTKLAVHKDAGEHKNTYPGLLGVQGAEKQLHLALKQAKESQRKLTEKTGCDFSAYDQFLAYFKL